MASNDDAPGGSAPPSVLEHLSGYSQEQLLAVVAQLQNRFPDIDVVREAYVAVETDEMLRQGADNSLRKVHLCARVSPPV